MKTMLASALLIVLVFGPVEAGFSGSPAGLPVGGGRMAPDVAPPARGGINPSGLFSRGSFRRPSEADTNGGGSSRFDSRQRFGRSRFFPFFGVSGPTYVPVPWTPPPQETPEPEKPRPQKNWTDSYEALKKTSDQPRGSQYNRVYRVGNYFSNTVPDFWSEGDTLVETESSPDFAALPGGLIQLRPAAPPQPQQSPESGLPDAAGKP